MNPIYQPDQFMSSQLNSATDQTGVAIIGMSCLFPGAPNVDAYWRNILYKIDAITDPPLESWDPSVYYNPTANTSDKVYCKRGGYLGSLVSFDPLPHGIPPLAVGGEPDQWLALQLARDALADAGYSQLDERVRQRTAVILGKGAYLNGGNAMVIQHSLVINELLEVLKRLHPEHSAEQIEFLRQELRRSLPPLGPETVPGLIPNIIVGRIANRLDLMGPTYTVDAACASSLVAVQLAMRDLLAGHCDLALAGGAQVWMPVATLNVFCQLGALSRREQIRPFDKDADGTLLGEGIGMVLLKRLADAERDGDRIYTVIKGVGVASDGRGMSVMAPRVEGEELALRRAYAAAGVSPRSVGLIEAHGTATPVGDVAEVEALTRVFGQRNGELPWCALGTVKSMISHTIPAAGVAGLIKSALALYHKVLPPTLNCSEPNPKLALEKTPFYLNTETRPWIHGGAEPRRAGVNAFGFGGINAHVVLEEYRNGQQASRKEHKDDTDHAPYAALHHLPAWESEVCILEGASPADLLQRVNQLAHFLERQESSPTGSDVVAMDRPGAINLMDLAYTLNSSLGAVEAPYRLAIVATSLADLQQKLARAAKRLAAPNCRQIKDVSGIYFAAEPLGRQGKLAFLFPGEGAQYPNMLADLCLHFPEVRECFDQSDRIFFGHPRGYLLSDYVFSRPSFAQEERRWAEQRLMQMDGAIEAVLTANQAMLVLMRGLRLRPDVIVGHSTGEFSAMSAAGILDVSSEERLTDFILRLNRHYEEVAGQGEVPCATLLAIGAKREQVEVIAAKAGGDVYLAMDNCPHQAVLVGEASAVERALDLVRQEGLIYERLTFDRAYHTPLFSPYANQLRQVLAPVSVQPPNTPVYSCATAAPYPTDLAAIRTLMIEQWAQPVEFQRTIESLYADGVRVFVEVGPRGNLSAFVEDILRGRPNCVIPADVQRRSGITQLNHLVGLLAVHCLNLDVGYLHQRRQPHPIAWEERSPIPNPGRQAALLKLSTRWPMLQLSDDAVQHMRQEAAIITATESRAEPPLDNIAQSQERANQAEERLPNTAVGTTTTFDGPSAQGMNTDAIMDSPPYLNSVATSDGRSVSAAMQAYFQTMDQFLTLQDEVMQAFLSVANAGTAPRGDDIGSQLPIDPGSDVKSKVETTISEPTRGATAYRRPVHIHALGANGSTAETPKVSAASSERNLLAVEAEQAIPTMSDRNIQLLHRNEFALAATLSEETVDSANQRKHIAHQLLTLVSERTGYPVEMLDWNLDLEADLSIDSIKRVEILGSYRQQFGSNAAVDLELLTTKRTLGEILNVLVPLADISSGVIAPTHPQQAEPGTLAADTLPSTLSYPLLGRIVSWKAGEELVAERTFDLAEDRYLRDHTLGGAVSITDPDLVALPVMPLTMSLEILAEAAACLVPGQVVISLHKVRAYRWLMWDNQPQTLQVTARRILGHATGTRIAVQLRNLTEDQQSDEAPKSPVIEATMTLATTYPPAPTARLECPRTGRPSHWRADQLYTDVMFHGPSWRGVTAITQTGDNGIVAKLNVLSFTGFFQSMANPRFTLDPVVLDAAGQVIGFWTMEHLEQAKVIFPFRIEAVEVYGPQCAVGEALTCVASTQLISDQYVRSNIDVMTANGSLWMRLIGWEDKRFDLPIAFQPLMLTSRLAQVSTEWPEPIARFPLAQQFQCRRVQAIFPSDRDFWKRIWSQRILSRREREEFRRMHIPEQQQVEWLAARAAAKEAIQQLLRVHYGLDLLLADIEIYADEQGHPMVGGMWRHMVDRLPSVSLAHTQGWAVALAGFASPKDAVKEEIHLRIGIEIKYMRALPDNSVELTFADAEQRILSNLPSDLRDEWAIRCWSAKEAVAKALGCGLVEDGHQSVVVVALDVGQEVVTVQVDEPLVACYPTLAGVQLVVYTNRTDDAIVATTLCERVEVTKSSSAAHFEQHGEANQ